LIRPPFLKSGYFWVIPLTLAALVAWWSPYFLKGWIPDSEWAYGLIWGDWLGDRLFLVTRHIIPEWNPNYVLGVNYIGRDPFNNPLSLGNAFKFFFSDPKKEFVFGVFFYLVVMAVGIRPNVQLAKDSGIYVNRGIVVNDYMETDVPNIYAVGEIGRAHV